MSGEDDFKFKGFFLHLREQKGLLDRLLWQFYRKLVAFLGFYDSGFRYLNFDDEGGTVTSVLLTAGALDSIKIVGQDEASWYATKDDFILFKGAYIQPFRDGTLLVAIVRKILRSIGEDYLPLELKVASYRFSGRTKANSRTIAWFVDTNFLAHLPKQYQVAFAVDSMLYSEWDLRSQNLVGLHMLALAWMLGVKEFYQFIPPGMRSEPAITNPRLKAFIDKFGAQMNDGQKSGRKK